MRTRELSLILSAVFIWPVLACGENNLLDQIKAKEMPLSKLREYVLSCDESGIIKLANEAFQKGWDPHAVGVGILGPYTESQGAAFTVKQKLDILQDPDMHSDFREYAAAWGLKDRSLDLATFLSYADAVLRFFEDDTVDYFHKQGVPEWIREALRRKVMDLRKHPKDDAQEAMDDLYARRTRMMGALVAYLEENPKPSEGREGYSPSSFAAASLSEYVGWSVGESDSTNHGDAVRDAQRALARILEDDEYDAAAARTVLRTAEQSRLDQVLSEETVADITRDKRFAAEEDQRLLDAINQRIRNRNP